MSQNHEPGTMSLSTTSLSTTSLSTMSPAR